jgi:hypothetical protein
VIGTFITEWEAGRRNCERLLATQDSAQQVDGRLFSMLPSAAMIHWPTRAGASCVLWGHGTLSY